MASILVTGANRGLGLEFVRQYAAEDWRVFACTRRPEEAKELRAIADGARGRVSLHRRVGWALPTLPLARRAS